MLAQQRLHEAHNSARQRREADANGAITRSPFPLILCSGRVLVVSCAIGELGFCVECVRSTHGSIAVCLLALCLL
jgi:hypothetical protein